VVSGYATRTLRFIGANAEDQISHYSPVIAATRELLAANRSDAILEGSLSLDDIFVFSAKIESVKAKVVGSKIMLVPASSLDAEKIIESPLLFADLSGRGVEPAFDFGAASSKTADLVQRYATVIGGQSLKDGTNTFTIWNFDISAFNAHAPWMPLTVYFIPRRVWILELFPRDPYYSSGKSILVIDSESMLPIYKVVHDRKGEVEKTVLAAWSFAKSADGSKSFPFPGFILSVNRNARQAMTFTSQRVQTYWGKLDIGGSSLEPLVELPKEKETETTDPEKEGDENEKT
jgi:hypothetical protein